MNLVFWTWCLPQMFLGFLVYSFLKVRKRVKDVMRYGTANVVLFKKGVILSGASLGRYIFVPDFKMRIVKHEYGHTKQSLMLGPLYLILIGLPSVFWNLLSRVSPYIRETYYSRYPENWADKLGGLDV